MTSRWLVHSCLLSAYVPAVARVRHIPVENDSIFLDDTPLSDDDRSSSGEYSSFRVYDCPYRFLQLDAAVSIA